MKTPKHTKENTVFVSGFTLIEMVMAMATFMGAIAIIFGIITNTLRTNRDVNDLIITNSDAAIITEMLTREIRAGYNFTVNNPGGHCAVGGSEIFFMRDPETFSPAVNIIYRWDTVNGTVTRLEDGLGRPINSTRTNVARLCFIMQGGPDGPHRITTVFSLEPVSGRLHPFHFQTTVSSRTLPQDL